MANKNSVNVQLNINTAFKNVKQAVDSLKKELSNINISSSLGNDLINNFQKQAAQIKQTLSQVGNFDFSTGDTKEYSKLVQQLKNEYASLNSMVKQYSDTFISTTQKNIAKQTEAIAAQKKQKEAYDAELNSLLQGKAAYDALQSGSSDLTAKEKELAATYEQNIPRINELNSEIKSLSKSMAGHKGELTKNEAALNAYNQVLEVENQQSKVIKNEIEQVINSRKNEVVQIKETEAAQKAAAEAQAKVIQEQQKQTQEAVKTQKKLEDAQKQWAMTSATFVNDFKAAKSGSESLTNSISKQILQWTSFSVVVGTAKRAITDIIQTYQELDDNLSAISAVSGISTQQLWGDMPSMIDNANKLALTVDDLTNGMLLFYQQGLSAADTEIRLEAAGKMAAISQQDLATAVDQLTSAMNAFNMTSDQAQNVVDVYAALAGATAVDVQELAAAMSRTASIAQNAGLTFEQTAAFLTTMEETTRLSSETIGNSFKSIIARFTQLRASTEALEDGVDANKVETALKTAGVALRDANGEFRDLGEVLMELSSKWDTLDSNTQKYIATIAAGTQQQSNFIALISQHQANIDNLNTAYNAAGAAEQQFQAISNNLTSAFNRLDNSFTALKTSWTDGINILTMLTDMLSALLLGISKIPTGIQAIIAVFSILLVRTIALSAAEAERLAIQKLSDIIEKSSLDAIQKKAVAETTLIAVKKKLTAEQLKALLTQEGYNKEQVESIANTYAQAASTNLLGNSFRVLKAQIAAAARSMWAFVTTPVGLAITVVLAAIAVGVGAIAYKFEQEKKAAQETQEAIDQLNQSSQEHADLASQYTDEAKSLEEYSQKLKEAYANGQDLTDLKTELANTFGEETLGVDAQKVSYQELSKAIEDAIKQKKELIQLETAESLIDKAQSNQTEAERLEKSFQKTKPEKQYYDSNGVLITDEAYRQAEGEAKGRAMDVEDVLQEKGYTTKLIYTIKDGDEVLYQGDLEGYQKKLQSLQQQFYTESEAQSLYTYAKDKGADFGDNLNENQIVNTIQLAAQQLGTEMTDPNNGLSKAYFDFQNQIEQVQQQVEQQLGVSTKQFFDFLNGNYSDLSAETLQSLTNYFNQLNNDYNTKLQQGIDLTPAENALRQANDNLKQTFNEEYSKIADYGIISKDDAEKIGLENLQRIVAAFESGGAKAAETLKDLITGVISDGFSDAEIKDSDLQDLKDNLENLLGDAFKDIDFSSLETAFEDLMSSYNDGDIDFSKLIDSLELLKNACPSAADALQQVISALQAEKAAQEDTFASMTDINNIWSNFNDGLSVTQKLISDTGATFEEVSNLANLLGVSIDNLIAGGKLELVGKNYHTNAQQAQEWITSLYGLSDAQLSSAQADYEAAAATATATASKIASYKQELDAAISAAKGTLLSSQANANAIPSFNALKEAGTKAALGIRQLNIQLDQEAPSVDAVADANEVTVGDLQNLISEMESYSASLGQAQADQENAASSAKAQADFIANLRTELTAAKNDWKNYGNAASSGGGGGSKDAADGVDEATEALEAQKEAIQEDIDKWEDYKSKLEDSKQALEDQKSALEDLNDKLKDNLELYLDLIKTKLEDEIDKQTTAVEAYYDAIKDVIQKQIDVFDKQLDDLSKKADELQDKADKLQEEAEKQEDSLNKLYDAATSYYEAVQSGIENEINLQDDVIEKNEYKISLLEDQKDAIQEQIDNLDAAADSESKLLALEKARDALANARNQKTRMVLTNGGGWRLKTDTSAVQEAQSNLASAETDYQKELLERQQDKLDEQISQLEEENDKIEEIQDDLEAQNDLIDNIKQDWDDAADNLGKTTSELEEQTKLLQMIASTNEAGRNDLLNGFQSNVAQNNNQFQTAADAANEANEASNKYDYQNNADNQDSIAAAIEALKQQQNLADEAQKQYFENLLSNNAQEVAISNEMKELVSQMVGNGGSSLEAFLAFQEQINGALESANEFASNQAAYINKINDTIAFYEEWSNRLDMTSSEINERQQIMNEINNATLSSLLEGGSTFNQLQGQYNEIIRNNDEAVKIQGQIDNLDVQIDNVQSKIDELKAQQDEISEQEKALSNANTEKTTQAAKSAGNTAATGAKKAGTDVSNTVSNGASNITTSVDSMSEFQNPLIQQVASAMNPIKQLLGEISKKEFKVTINNPASSYLGGVGGRSSGGPIGFSTGGVDDFTSMVAVHGTKNRPELVLNNSQSAALFKYIDSMTRIPTLSSAGSARNALQAFNTTNNTTNEGTSFTGCEFNIESNANNLDSLVKELRQSSSIRRK